MPETPKPKPDPDYLGNAKANLIAPFNISQQQYTVRIAAAQVQATIALAEQQARAADALETANLIAYLQTGPTSWAYHPGENVLKNVQAQIETRLGLA
jgi:hypothetical protein